MGIQVGPGYDEREKETNRNKTYAREAFFLLRGFTGASLPASPPASLAGAPGSAVRAAVLAAPGPEVGAGVGDGLASVFPMTCPFVPANCANWVWLSPTANSICSDCEAGG